MRGNLRAGFLLSDHLLWPSFGPEGGQTICEVEKIKLERSCKLERRFKRKFERERKRNEKVEK